MSENRNGKKTKEPSKHIDNDYFESVILYNLLTNEAYLNAVIDVAKPEYFTNQDIRPVVSILHSFFSEFGTAPNTTEIKSRLTSVEAKDSFKRIVTSFKHLDSKYNFDALINDSERFFREKAVYLGVTQTINDYSSGNIDTHRTLSLFENACNISLIDDLGHDYFTEVDKHIKDLQEVYSYISTGWSWLDQKLG
ncbi:MAG: hypothetical protein ABIO05_05020, partial [Ferruginibacter sp.]